MSSLNPLVLDLAVKGTLLLVAAFALALLLRRSSAAARHLHWQLALGGLLALPLLAAVTPRLAVPAGPLAGLLAPATVEDDAPAARAAGTTRRATAPRLQAAIDDPGRDGRASEAERPAVTQSAPAELAPPALRPAEARPQPRRPAFAFLFALTPLQQVLLAWGAGASVVLGLLGLGLARARALSRRATPVTDPAWGALADRVRRDLGLRRPVELRRVPRCVVPMTFGWRRPVVLLPSDSDQWSPSRRRHVLLHELAHVRRADWLGQIAAQAAVALWWWQPLAWIAARELRRQRELACDDQVLAFGSRASEYADHLLAIAASRGTGLATGAATLAMARRSQLEGRLLAVLQDGRSRHAPTPRRTLVSVAGATALVAALACVQPQAAEPGSEPASDDPVDAGSESPAPVARNPVAVSVPAPRVQPAPHPELVTSPIEPATPVAPRAPHHGPHARTPHPPRAPAAPRARHAPTMVVTAPSEIDPEWLESLEALEHLDDLEKLEGLQELTGLEDLHTLVALGYLNLECGDRSIWTWTENDESWTVVASGWVEPDETGTRVAHVDEDGSFLIQHDVGSRRDSVQAVAADDGVRWTGNVDGQELDAEAARTAAEGMLDVVLARSSLFASERVAHLVDSEGTAGALEALRTMPAEGARSDLLSILIQEHELETEEFAAAIELAAEGGSDAAVAELLACVGPDALGDPDLVEPVFAAVEGLDSDAQQAETLGHLLGSEYADAPVLARALRAAARGVESDAYMAELLEEVPASRLRDDTVREAFVAALLSVESDAYAAGVVGPLPEARGVKGETLVALIEAATQSIDSDAYMAEVLEALPARAMSDASAREALLAALASVESDAYCAEVAQHWIVEHEPPADLVVALVEAAALHVDSDPYLAQVLTAPGHLRDDAAVRAAVEAALAGIESRAYAAEVRAWLVEEE